MSFPLNTLPPIHLFELKLNPLQGRTKTKTRVSELIRSYDPVVKGLMVDVVRAPSP